jgi:adenylate kinase
VDDSEEAIRHRQEVYQRETAPLLEMFRDRELLVEVDGLGAVDDISQRIFVALAERGLVAEPTSAL